MQAQKLKRFLLLALLVPEVLRSCDAVSLAGSASQSSAYAAEEARAENEPLPLIDIQPVPEPTGNTEVISFRNVQPWVPKPTSTGSTEAAGFPLVVVVLGVGCVALVVELVTLCACVLRRARKAWRKRREEQEDILNILFDVQMSGMKAMVNPVVLWSNGKENSSC
uniref:Uncharacterized protein 13 n=1 Tax=Halisarca dujardinii TaxID=2583056 RepID=A0AA96S2G8_HALDU|nr:uncharacterized protein 13 [Halisarca dujardinii]